MNLFKKTAVAASLAAGLLVTTSATAADLDTTVTLNVPQVLIIYGYEDIELNASSAALTDALHNGLTGDFLTSATAPGSPFTVNDLDGTVNVDAGNDAAFNLSANPTITLQNAFGVRALGYNGYTATVAEPGTQFVGESVTTPTYTGLALSTGDLSFEIDLDQISSVADTGGTASGTFTITVTGN